MTSSIAKDLKPKEVTNEIFYTALVSSSQILQTGSLTNAFSEMYNTQAKKDYQMNSLCCFHKQTAVPLENEEVKQIVFHLICSTIILLSQPDKMMQNQE